MISLHFRDKGFLSNIIPIPPETHHGYSLRSGCVVNSSVKVVARTERMNNFCTYINNIVAGALVIQL